MIFALVMAFALPQGPVKPENPDERDDPVVAWAGPSSRPHSFYDVRRLRVPGELDHLETSARALAGAVKARALTAEAALANARALFDAEEWKAFAASKEARDASALQGSAATKLMNGDALGAVACLLLARDAEPGDANVAFNLAGMLAHAGLPNECLALLDAMEKAGKKPEPALGLDADATVAAVRGYALLAIGKLDDAEAQARVAVAKEPFLSEATLLLVSLELLKGQRDKARKSYVQGVWRRRASPLMVCDAGKDKPPEPQAPPTSDDAKAQEADTLRIAPEEFFDLSRGKAGKLPQFNHPNTLDEARALLEKLRTLQAKVGADMIADTMASSTVVMSDLSKRAKTSAEARCEAISQSIEGLEEHHAVVGGLHRKQDKAYRDLFEHLQRIGKEQNEKLVALFKEGGDRDKEYREVAEVTLGKVRAHIQGYEVVLRRHHRVWHRYATGLASNLGDKPWLRMQTLRIHGQTGALWLKLLQAVEAAYRLALLPPFKAEKAKAAAEPGDLEKEDVEGCPDGLKGHGLKFEIGEAIGLKFSLKLQCEKVNIEVAKDIVKTPKGSPIEAGVGGFVQLELSRKGDATVFLGPRGKLGVANPLTGTSAGISAKEGVYVKFDSQGVKDVGTKILAESYATVGKLSSTTKLVEKTFSFMPSVPAPRGGPNLPVFVGK